MRDRSFDSGVVSLKDRIDQICDLFESAWVAGGRPLIEEFVALDQVEDRDSLFQELVLVEWEVRTRRGENPTREEYLRRFPEFSSVIAGIDFQGLESNDATNRAQLSESSVNPTDDTRSFASGPEFAEQRFGRYRVLGVLGEGGFGLVYLGFDVELRRQVAIKVPTAKRFRDPQHAETYMAEARIVAGLDHPNIVPVHDVGRTDDGSVYVVSKLINGRSLKELIKDGRPDYADSADLVMQLAHALHHAHQRRLVHRDIKPANLLIDETTRTPYLADFGLALREEFFSPDSGLVGTPGYMSPEQARGEGHRLDGRSDIFSLGVVFYELLTGVKPFRGTSEFELLHEITSVDPLPPREISESIPPELERICMKCLAKRAADRYATAAILADDLLNWRQGEAAGENEARIIPRGLRSFDSEDASFFLELLPGPRGRDGLPESVRFWKSRVEDRDPDNTFAIGLIYGPSGCGKSSLMKAGLLPRLSKDIVVAYIEATSAETEIRLLRALRRRLPQMNLSDSLPEALAEIRRQHGGKVLIVLDQFEQWLHSHSADQGEDLVRALRQCDGCALQAIVMIRDDFAMAAARFMDALDISILQGHNFATVDLFDVEHAKKVLTKLGQAYGKLPSKVSNLSEHQKQFINEVVSGLGRDGRVISVQLALFAEMVKDHLWHPETLNEVGGTEGIGINFLENSFDTRSANPQHRLHKDAARKVLAALLPEVGSDIKGHMRSYAELLDISGYKERPHDFSALLRVLDGELRLITPTDATDGRSGNVTDPSAKWYQLTHDYLVPPVREWLTRHQRNSRKGRAELCLAERAAIWSARPENRHLPTTWEYARIVGFTKHADRSPSQRQMMAAARKVLALRWTIRTGLAASVLVCAVAIWKGITSARHLDQVNGQIDQLFVASTADMPAIIASLDQQMETAQPRLLTVSEDVNRPMLERLRATLALIGHVHDAPVQLVQLSASADPQSLQFITSRVQPFAATLKERLWNEVRNNAAIEPTQLRRAALLAVADPSGDGWSQFSPVVADVMLAENEADLATWIELLRPASQYLIPSLQKEFLDSAAPSNGKEQAARVLAAYAGPDLLGELLLKADRAQFVILFPSTAGRESTVIRDLSRNLSEVQSSAEDIEQSASSIALRNAAIALIRLGAYSDAEPLFTASPNPTVRTALINQFAGFETTPELLVSAFEHWRDPAARQAALLALEPFLAEGFSKDTEEKLEELILEAVQSSATQSERSAAQWLATRWQRSDLTEAFGSDSAKPNRNYSAPPRRLWSINSQGQTMVVFKVSRNSSPSDVPYDFEISACEVTMSQFRKFQPTAQFAVDVAEGPECPANKVSFAAAMQYCEWLNKQEGVPDDQSCYQGDGEKSSPTISQEKLLRTGYRLPTSDEWEFVCRAGSETAFFCGNDEPNVQQFGWYQQNSGQKLHPAGSLRPNAFGLFDMMGNVAEWCHPGERETRFLLRGGAYTDPAKRLRSDSKYFQSAKGWSYAGFRLARTLAEGK